MEKVHDINVATSTSLANVALDSLASHFKRHGGRANRDNPIRGGSSHVSYRECGPIPAASNSGADVHLIAGNITARPRMRQPALNALA
jgi:hypothetical protein